MRMRTCNKYKIGVIQICLQKLKYTWSLIYKYCMTIAYQVSLGIPFGITPSWSEVVVICYFIWAVSNWSERKSLKTIWIQRPSNMWSAAEIPVTGDNLKNTQSWGNRMKSQKMYLSVGLA